jgi:hypothetical protein
MSETRTLELRVKDNANEVQQQFENLRQQIAKTTQEVDELTQAYGENSQEVTAAKNKLTELTTSYKELNKSATDTGATFANVYGEIQPLTTRMGEAEDRLYELAAAGKTASKEYQDLLQTTQNYLRIQQSVDLQVEAGAVPAAQKMTMAVGGVAGAFGVAEGAAALFGVESQKLQETMVRLQAAMTITQGLTTIREAIPTFQAMGEAAKNALSGIRTGVAATGIGLLVVAVGTLVAYWDDIKLAVTGVSNEQKKYMKELDKDIVKQEHKGDMLDAQENILKLQGKSEKEILQIKIKQIEGEIELAENKLKNTKANAKIEIEAAERNMNWMKTYVRITLEGMLYVVRAIALPIDAVIAGANTVSKALGIGEVVATNLNEYISQGLNSAAEWTAKLLFDPKETKEKSDATIRALELGLEQMKGEKAGFELEIKALEQGGAASSVSTAAGAAQEQIDITRQMEEEKNRLMEEGRAKDLDALRIKYKYEKQEADKNLKENKLSKENYDKLIKQQVESLELDTKAINDKYDKIERDARDLKLQEQIKAEDAAWLELQKARNSQREQELLDLQLAYDAKIEAANGNAEAEKAITERFNKEYAAINKKYSDAEAEEKKKKDEEELARIQELNKAKFQLAYDGLSLVSELSSLFGEQDEKKARLAFQVDKAAKISSATIAGYEAVLEAYKTGQKSPLTVAFPAYPYVQAGLAGAFAAVNIAKIAKAKFQASGGGGSMSPSGGGGAGGGAMTANFNTIGSSGINQLAQLQQTPTQAYVVSGEVTSAQALDRNRVQNATL